MRTDNIRKDIRAIHESALDIANKCADAGRGARVLGNAAVVIERDDAIAIGDMIHSLMGVNNSTLFLLDQQENLENEYRKMAFDGVAFLGFVKGASFRQLLAWWLKHHYPRQKQVRA